MDASFLDGFAQGVAIWRDFMLSVFCAVAIVHLFQSKPTGR